MRDINSWIYTLRWAFLLGLWLTCFFAAGQDWQSTYNQALAQYQSEDFQNSIVGAEAALEKSRSTNVHNQAYSLQLITSNCISLEDADKGLNFIDEEISLFRQLEGSKSKSLAEAMKKQIMFLTQKGMTSEAFAKTDVAMKSFTESYGSAAPQTTQFNVLVGDIYLTHGDSAKAKEKWSQCIPLLATQSALKDDYKNLLYSSAALDENLKDYSSAKSKFSTLVELLEKENQTNDPLYESSKKVLTGLNSSSASSAGKLEELLKKALTLQSQRQIGGALTAYQQAVVLADKDNAKTKTAFSIYLNYARLLLSVDGDHKPDEPFQKAKSLSSLFRPGDFELLLVSLTEADISLAHGEKEKATTQYFGLSRLLSKTNFPQVAANVFSSANRLLDMNLPRTAAKLLRPSMCCLSENGTTEPFLTAALIYSDALLAVNQPDSVLQVLNPSVFANNLPAQLKKNEALQTKGQSVPALDNLLALEKNTQFNDKAKADVAYEIAKLSQKTGDYTKAEIYYQKAIQLFEKVSPEDGWYAGNSMATLYSSLGNFDKSEKIINDLLQKVPAGNALRQALLSNLSANYIETFQFEKAKGIQQQIVASERQTHGENHPDYAIAISNLAALYQREGRYADARKLFEQALGISKINFGELSADYALRESNLGAILKDMGDLNAAQIALGHAEKVLSERIGKSHPNYVQCEYNLALVFQRNGNPTKAVPFMQHLAEFYKKQILEFFPAMSEQEQTAFYNKINRAVQDYQQFAMEHGVGSPEMVGQLFDFRLATKALLLNSSLKIRERILSQGDPKLKAQFLSWLSLKEELGKLYNAERNSQSGSKIAQLETQANDLEKKLSESSAIFKNDKDERSVDWKKIQSALQPDEAAVEFIRVKASGKTDSVSYAALILRKDIQQPKLVVFSSGRKMEGREFSFYKNNIVLRQVNDRSYNIYWKPMESALQGVRTIYFSADGAYNKINLTTLLDPSSKQFLNSRYEFVLVSNLRDILILNHDHGSTQKTAQLFGPISFGDELLATSNVARTVLSSGVPSLPGTKIEIEKIDQVLKNVGWQSTEHLEGDASEHNVKALASPTIVHIATHGFFVDSENDDGEVENPLLKSGLLLPEKIQASKSAEDGMLTAYEVKNLNFDKTDLVVLSACETGSGEVRNGEGVYGLQRSFLISGVKNILMSLWKVDDQATQELMVLFYQNLVTNHNTADALRLAQSELIKKYPDPYFWGSFVLIGKPQ